MSSTLTYPDTLTPREASLFLCLSRDPYRVHTYEEIMETIFPGLDGYKSKRVIDATAESMMPKLVEAYGYQPMSLFVDRGYRLENREL